MTRSRSIVMLICLAACWLPLSATRAPQGQAAARLELVRAQIADGRYEEAWTGLQDMPATADVLRLQTAVGLHLGRIDLALRAYDQLVQTAGKDDAAIVRDIGKAVLQQLRTNKEPLISSSSCASLLLLGVSECRTELVRDARTKAVPLTVRLSAASALVQAGDASGLAILREVIADAGDASQLSIADAVRGAPPNVAGPILVGMLASPSPPVQYVSALALGDLQYEGSRSALAAVAWSERPSPARLAAKLSLARLGDPRALKEVGDALPRLEGADLLSAGCALAAAGDPRGVPAIERVATGDHESLRLLAAEQLAGRNRQLAAKIIEDAFGSPNPMQRQLALVTFTRVGWPPPKRVRDMVNDPDVSIRLSAANALIGIEALRTAAAKKAAATTPRTR